MPLGGTLISPSPALSPVAGGGRDITLSRSTRIGLRGLRTREACQMTHRSIWLLGLSLAVGLATADMADAKRAKPKPAPNPLAKIETIVVIYDENRSFDNL